MKPLQICALVLLTSLVPVAHAADAVRELLTEAQAAYLKGDLDVAKAKFQSVNKLDPKNQTAIGYLRMIQAKQAQNVGAAQDKQLSRLIVPSVQFREATLDAALDYLKQAVTKLTDGKQAVNFVVQVPPEQAKSLSLTLNLTNVPFTEVLKYLGSLANVTFVYDRYAITVRPNDTASTVPAPATQ